jgi:hypothetical protein
VRESRKQQRPCVGLLVGLFGRLASRRARIFEALALAAGGGHGFGWVVSCLLCVDNPLVDRSNAGLWSCFDRFNLEIDRAAQQQQQANRRTQLGLIKQ